MGGNFIRWAFGWERALLLRENFVYFIGGTESEWGHERRLLRDVDRYDHHRNHWDKLADIQVARMGCGWGAAADGKIFIAGGRYFWWDGITRQLVWSVQWNNKWIAVSRRLEHRLDFLLGFGCRKWRGVSSELWASAASQISSGNVRNVESRMSQPWKRSMEAEN